MPTVSELVEILKQDSEKLSGLVELSHLSASDKEEIEVVASFVKMVDNFLEFVAEVEKEAG